MNLKEIQIPNLEIKVLHRNWEKALAKAYTLLSIASPGDVIAITGPSRGGKSKLVEELESMLICDDIDLHEYMPVVKIDAANDSTNGQFSTKEFTYRLLDTLKHPTLSLTGDYIEDKFILKKLSYLSEWKMRIELEKSLIRRKTRFLIIDEAQHVKYASKNAQAPEAVMDSWKCMAKEANIVLVIVGAYPILNIIQKSPHLIGRKTTVDLRRYTLQYDDIRAFTIILDSFSSILNLSPDLVTLRNCAEILYHGSFGCIGLLKKWLKEALVEAVIENRGIISRNIIIKTTPPDSDRKEIIKEIVAGEKALENIQLFSDIQAARTFTNENETKSSNPKKSGKQKPFTQTPKRLKSGQRICGDI